MKNNLFKEMRPYSYAVSLAPEYKIGKDIRLYNKKLYNEYFTGSSDFQIKIVNAFLRFSLFPQLAQISMRKPRRTEVHNTAVSLCHTCFGRYTAIRTGICSTCRTVATALRCSVR